MTNWRPIETAPKDGTRILICTTERSVIEVSWWDSWYNDTSQKGWMPANRDEEYGCLYDATHWQSLPDPPKEVDR